MHLYLLPFKADNSFRPSSLYVYYIKCIKCFTDVCDVCAFYTYNKDYLLTYLLIYLLAYWIPVGACMGRVID